MKRRDFLSASAVAAAWGMGRVMLGAEPEADWPDDLSQHRIEKIDTFTSRDQYCRSLGPNARLGPHGRGYSRPFRIVTTNHGAVGMGMCWPKEEVIRPFVGATVGDLIDPDEGVVAKAEPLDFVLHDLAGVILQKPVYKLLGSAGPKQLPVYSGAIYMDDLMPKEKPRGIEAVVEACKMDYDAGYRAFKLKIGRGNQWMPTKEGDRRDIEVTRRVRERFPDCKIMVDANDGYTVDRFLDYVSAVADCELYIIEEPFDEHRDGLVRLREHMEKVGCKAMIADGEYRKENANPLGKWGEYTKPFVERFFKLAEEKLIDVCVFDISSLGFSRWRRQMPVFKKAGIKTAPHLWGCTPKPFYCAHLAAGLGNVVIIEGIPGTGERLDYSGYRIAEGKMHVPSTPGFGIGLAKGKGIAPKT